MALRKPVDLSRFRGLPDVTVIYNSNDRWYRYTSGTAAQEEEAAGILETLIGKGFKDAFIRRKDPVLPYTIQVMAVPGPVVDLSGFSNLTEILVKKGDDNYCRYTSGAFETEEEAALMLERIKSMGHTNAFIRKAN
jgi:cell division protein FtsN